MTILAKNKNRLEAWFAFPFAKAVAFWGSPTLALIMEAPAGSPLQKQFRLSLDRRARLSTERAGWGVPDIRSARNIAGVSAKRFKARFRFCDDHFDTLELGWACPTIDQAMDMCSTLGWPLGLLFRNIDGKLHRMVELSRLDCKTDVWG
jgi:hypothetical protein